MDTVIEQTGQLTFGTWAGIVWLGLLGLVIIGCLFVAVADEYARGGALLIGGGVALLGIGSAVINFWPADPDYFSYTKVQGTIESSDSRLIGRGDGMTERFVLTIGGQQYGVEDTRAASVDVGDPVGLNCTKEWQWGSDNHGWACKWSSVNN